MLPLQRICRTWTSDTDATSLFQALSVVEYGHSVYITILGTSRARQVWWTCHKRWLAIRVSPQVQLECVQSVSPLAWSALVVRGQGCLRVAALLSLCWLHRSRHPARWTPWSDSLCGCLMAMARAADHNPTRVTHKTRHSRQLDRWAQYR